MCLKIKFQDQQTRIVGSIKLCVIMRAPWCPNVWSSVSGCVLRVHLVHMFSVRGTTDDTLSVSWLFPKEEGGAAYGARILYALYHTGCSCCAVFLSVNRILISIEALVFFRVARALVCPTLLYCCTAVAITIAQYLTALSEGQNLRQWYFYRLHINKFLNNKYGNRMYVYLKFFSLARGNTFQGLCLWL